MPRIIHDLSYNTCHLESALVLIDTGYVWHVVEPPVSDEVFRLSR